MSSFTTGQAARVAAMAAGTAAVMLVGAGAASATTVLAGGATAPSGSLINAPLVFPNGGVVLVTPNGYVSCVSGNLSGTIGTNPTASGSSVTGVGNQFNLGACTDTIGGAAIVVNSAALVSGTTPALSILGGPGGGTLSIRSPQIRVSLTSSGLPATCTFTVNNATTTATAALTNSNSRITFSSVPAITSASGVCNNFNPTPGTPATTNFSAVFGPATTFIGSSLVTVAP